MRSREISVSIIIQNLAQLKSLFEKQWESLVGNCDEFLYMGGNEQSTHEYVSKLLGKETIDTNTYGQSKARSGSYSTNWQLTGRELLMPDEVRMLDNQYALLFIRGERPVRDLKYDILKHPNIKLTTDGGADVYKRQLLIRCDGDEGLFCAYDNIEFLAPVYAGDYIEAKGEITYIGNTSRKMTFTAYKVITARPDVSASAADVLDEPVLVCRALSLIHICLFSECRRSPTASGYSEW